jgi:hypothetical protein
MAKPHFTYIDPSADQGSNGPLISSPTQVWGLRREVRWTRNFIRCLMQPSLDVAEGYWSVQQLPRHGIATPHPSTTPLEREGGRRVRCKKIRSHPGLQVLALTGGLTADRVPLTRERPTRQIWADSRAVEVLPDRVQRDLHGGSRVDRVGDCDVA